MATLATARPAGTVEQPTVYALVVLRGDQEFRAVSEVVVAFESAFAAHRFALSRGIAGYRVGPIVFDEHVPA